VKFSGKRAAASPIISRFRMLDRLTQARPDHGFVHQVLAVIKAEIRNNVSAKLSLPGEAINHILTRPTDG
jgi:hypothetical protein